MKIINSLKNVFRTQKIKNNGGSKRLVYIIRNIKECGGVETKLSNMFSFLEKKGYDINLITDIESNNKSIFSKFKVFQICFRSYNTTHTIVKICDRLDPFLIEFQITGHKDKFINYNKIMKRWDCGIQNHGITYEFFKKALYNAVNSINTCKRDAPGNYDIFPNMIPDKVKLSLYKREKQNKAIIISRLDPDKLDQIRTAIKYCKSVRCNFEIAGISAFSYSVKEQLKKEFDLKDDCFIGKIKTLEHLNQNKYRFVCGVGNVVLEASLLGLPVFVSSHINYNGFLNKSNFIDCMNRNFVGFSNKQSNILNYESLRDLVLKYRSIDRVMNDYIKMIHRTLKYEKD